MENSKYIKQYINESSYSSFIFSKVITNRDYDSFNRNIRNRMNLLERSSDSVVNTKGNKMNLSERSVYKENTQNDLEYKIIGMRLIYYISDSFVPSTKYIIYCKNNNNKIEIILDSDNEIMQIRKTNNFKFITMICSKNIYIDINNLSNINAYDILSKNIHIFNKTIKHKEKRPVWIFGGSYNNAIKYFGKKMKSYSIDENKILPTVITSNSIIMSSYSSDLNITIEDIKKNCIGNNEYIFVGFEKIINKNISLLSKMCYIKYVYIFTGERNVGKRYISTIFNGKSVYETIYSETLPNIMDYDFVIINSEFRFTYNDIINRYKGNNIFVSVHFTRI